MRFRSFIAFAFWVLFCAEAFATSITLTGAGKPPIVAVSINQTDTGVDVTNVCTTCSFTTKNIGTASATRVVGVVVFWVNIGGGTINSVTINGVSAAAQVQATKAANVYRNEVWTAVVPTGTSVTIDVGISASADMIGIAVYEIQGAASATATATSSDVSNSNPQTCSMNIVANGGGIALAMANVNQTYTWTGLAENFDSLFGGNGASGASQVFAAAQTPLASTVTGTSGFTVGLTSCAAFGP